MSSIHKHINNALSSLEKKPIINSLVIALILFLSTNIIFPNYWSGGKLLYIPTASLLSPSELWLVFATPVGFAIAIIKFIILYFPIYLMIVSNKLTIILRFIILSIFFLFVFYAQDYYFYNLTTLSLDVRDIKMGNKILSDLENLKTKDKVESYIKSDKNYLETSCFVEKISDPSSGKIIDFINVPEVEGYLGNSKKTVFCNIKAQINEDYIDRLGNLETKTTFQKVLFSEGSLINDNQKSYEYDCIYLYKNHTSHRICFKNNETKIIDSTLENDSWTLKFDYGIIKNDYNYKGIKTYYKYLVPAGSTPGDSSGDYFLSDGIVE